MTSEYNTVLDTYQSEFWVILTSSTHDDNKGKIPIPSTPFLRNSDNGF